MPERDIGGKGRFKVITLVGTRPELIKLSRVIAELDRHVIQILVHSGQNHAPELSARLFEDLDIREPDNWLRAAGASAIDTITQTISRFDAVLERESPDAVLFYGDTDTGLAMIAAKRRKIPIFHMEAGNRCYDETVPEEVNRRLLDHLSDVNLSLSEAARRCLLAEGLPADRIFKTGSPMPEVLKHAGDKIAGSTILKQLDLSPGGYMLASVHRAENVDAPGDLHQVLGTLSAVSNAYGIPVLVSTHPRTHARMQQLELKADIGADVRFHPPFVFSEYVALQKGARCVLSDSGSLTEEASILDLPAVALRRQHERFEGMDEGTVVLAGLGTERVLDAIRLVLDQRRDGARSTPPVADYQKEDVSRHVVRLILSYTDYVRRTVWKQLNG
jgi:UDP-N-acetylglucosamine 2-epimerase (non-hydrolysing)